LWDALKDALILELKDDKQYLFVELCNLGSRNSAKKEMLIEVLTEYAELDDGPVLEILAALQQNGRHVDAASVAGEVAYNLGEVDVLEQMAQHREGAFRRVAAQFTYYVWRTDSEAAFGVLDRLAARIRRGLVPDSRALGFCVALSIQILFEGYSRPQSVERLRGVWVCVLDKVLYRDWDHLAVIGSIVRWLREQLLIVASCIVWLLFAQAWDEWPSTSFDRRDLQSFLKQDKPAKQRAARLVSYLDLDRDLRETWDDLCAVLRSDDYLANSLGALVVAAHGLQYDTPVASPETNPVLPFIKELLDYALDLEPTPAAISWWLLLLSGVTRAYRAEAIDDHLLEMYEDTLRKYYERDRCISPNPRGHSELATTGFGYYTQLLYVNDPALESELLDKVIPDAFRKGHREFLARYIRDVSGVSPARRIWASLRALQPILTELPRVRDESLRDSLRGELVMGLSRLRIYAPKAVEQFLDSLEESETVDRIRQEVQASERRETLFDMSVGRGIWFIHEAVLQQESKLLLNEFISWLQDVVKSKSLAAALRPFLKAMVNLIYMPDKVSVFKEPDLVSKYRERS
jgi:hypothetical protein